MINLEGISLPFTINDLLDSGMAIFGLVGSFVLLGLAFVFVPKLIESIRYAFILDKMDRRGSDPMILSSGARSKVFAKRAGLAFSQKRNSSFWND